MKDYKFNTNDQQLRGFAMEIANSNAPQGTLPELIMADAEKIVEYVRDGLPPESELGQTIERVQLIRSMQNEQAWKKQELEQRIEQDKIDRAEAEWAAENGITLQLDAGEGEVFVEEGALTTDVLEEMRNNAIADGALTPEDVEDIRADAVAPEEDPEFLRLLAEEEAIEAEVALRNGGEAAVRRVFTGEPPEEVTAEAVVKLVERGLTETEIANELGISVTTLRVLWSQFKSETQEENPPVVTSSSPAERGEVVVEDETDVRVIDNVGEVLSVNLHADGNGAPGTGVVSQEDALRRERIAAELRARQEN